MHAISLVQVALLALATSSLAFTVTEPAQGDTWSSGGPNLVSWTRVNTDSTTFSLALVQEGVFKVLLENNVDATQGSLTVTTSNLPVGPDFQVNIVNSTNTAAILAQSAQFNITQGGGSSSASSTGTRSSTISSSIATDSATANASPTAPAASGTNIPNSSATASNSTATKSNAASLSTSSHSGLLGLLALFGLALV